MSARTAWARLRVTGAPGTAVIVRALRLTPYDLELAADETRRAGPATRLELVRPRVDGRDASLLDAWIARLARRGVTVRVRTEGEPWPVPDAAVAPDVRATRR